MTAAPKALVICFLGSGKSSDHCGEMRRHSRQEAHRDSTRLEMSPVAGIHETRRMKPLPVAGQSIKAG